MTYIVAKAYAELAEARKLSQRFYPHRRREGQRTDERHRAAHFISDKIWYIVANRLLISDIQV